MLGIWRLCGGNYLALAFVIEIESGLSFWGKTQQGGGH